MIVPAIGCVVWFRPGNGARSMMNILGDQPLKADVIFIHTERMVNLSIIDHAGMHHVRTHIPLRHPTDSRPDSDSSYCEWPE